MGLGVNPSLHQLHPRGWGQGMSPAHGKGFATHHQCLTGILGFALPRGAGIFKGDIPM